jgi:hypothetical protein
LDSYWRKILDFIVIFLGNCSNVLGKIEETFWVTDNFFNLFNRPPFIEINTSILQEPVDVIDPLFFSSFLNLDVLGIFFKVKRLWSFITSKHISDFS